MTAESAAERTVSAVIAGMVTVTAAATVVGFWLSYDGLHEFAIRSGAFTGPEAWAFPASVDLFIAAGEAGVTIPALRRRRDPMAWAYLVLGFAASVTGNVLHVDPAHLAWSRYAVAAIPPAAAMLALAAVLRHAYRAAVEPPPEHITERAAGTVTEHTVKRAPGTEAQRAWSTPRHVGQAHLRHLGQAHLRHEARPCPSTRPR